MMRRWSSVLLAVVVGGGLLAVGWWAGREMLRPPPDPLAAADPISFRVEEGTLGRSLSFAAVAEWTLSVGPRTAATGTVTSIDVVAGATIDAGDVLFTVDLRPVVAMRGDVPAFRSMSSGDEGADVAQLQTFLTGGGFYSGDVDGKFGGGTVAAVRAWQRTLGTQDDGSVRHGDMVFFPELPVRVVPGDEVEVGDPLDGDAVAVRVVEGLPRFWIPLSIEQRSLVPLAAEVEVSFGDAAWDAVIVRAEERPDDGQLDLLLGAPGGGAVCGLSCEDAIPLGVRANFPARVVVIPATSGPVVPVAALITGPTGGVHVVMEDGSERSVEVRVSTDGLAVVDGVAGGETILLPGEGDAP